MHEIAIETSKHSQMLDITLLIRKEVPDNFSGVMTLHTPHTTAAICINEGADPDVKKDVIMQLDELIRWDHPKFKHMEGNSAAHIKAIMVGNTKQIIIDKGKLMLGTWEHIFFCEFDGPRRRKLWLQLSS